MQGLMEAPSSSKKMEQLETAFDATRDEVDGVTNIKLPAQLQKITPAREFVSVRHRWNTNEEIASILIAFDQHKEWLVLPQKIRPASGSMLLYNRKIVFYRRDGYCWKKRRNGSTIREDHMKLKVQGLECIYGSYVHSAILPTFHRRCYWLLQNPNIVLIHYLNVPYPEAAKPSIRPVSYELCSKDWSKEELVDQLRPMLSKVAEGTEHDMEEDQKVEKMLEEILLILMPVQEGSISKPVLAKAKSLASEPFGPSPTVGELTPALGPPSTCSAQARQTSQQQAKISCPQQGIQPQAVHSIRPAAVTSSSSPAGGSGISGGGNFSLGQNAAGKSVVASVNGAAGCHRLVVGAGGQLLPQGLLVANSTGSNMPRFITLGANHQLIMATSGGTAPSAAPPSACIMDATDGGLGDGTKPEVGSLPVSVMSCRTNGPSVFAPHPQSSLSFQTARVDTTSTSSSSTGILQTQAAALPTNLISVNQESHQGGHSSQYLQQNFPPSLQGQPQQQLAFNSTIQNPSQTLTPKVEGQNPGINESTGSTPVLTLHLKPTNNSSSDGPGFVLSLQGATIVSQHSSMPSTPHVSGPPSNFTLSNSNSGQNGSHGGLVLVASQSPDGGLILNKISSQPAAPPNPSAQSSQQGLFMSQHSAAPGAPSVCFAMNGSNAVQGAPFSTQGGSQRNLPFSMINSSSSNGQTLSFCGTTSSSNKNTSNAVSFGSNNTNTSYINSDIIMHSNNNNNNNSNNLIQNNNSTHVLPFGMSSDSNNKTCGVTMPFPQSTTTKGGQMPFSQIQTIHNSCSVANPPGMPRHKTVSSSPAITSILSQQQVPSQHHSFIYSSPTTTTTAMEEAPIHSNHIQDFQHLSQQHQQQQQQQQETGGNGNRVTQFELRQQQRFETISPPTVPTTTTTQDPNLFLTGNENPFTISSQETAPNNVFSAVHAMKDMDKLHQAAQAASPDQVLASLQAQSQLGTGSCYNGQLSKSDSLQGSMFSLESQANPTQTMHQSHRDTHIHTPDLMAGPSGLHSSVKDMITNPDSCDTLDGSFSSLPSADLNLDDLLDLNDLGDVSDLGCSPFTPPDLTQQTTDMDKTCISEHGNMTTQAHNSVSHTANMTTFNCSITPSMSHNHQLQQQQQMYQQQQEDQQQQQRQQQQQHHHHHHHNYQLHLTVPQHSHGHCEQQEEAKQQQQQPPSSPLHPGAPPRPMRSMLGPPAMSPLPSVCDSNLVIGHHTGSQCSQANDPEINSVIKDFSPDWAYIKTNTKVLIAGPWSRETSHYSCVFDGEHIPAILVQPGLLRCFTQYHNPGYATLQVARDGVVISNCEVFEFCDRENSNSTSHPEWFAFEVNQLKLLLVERLDQLRRRFVNMQPLCLDSISDDLEVLESSLVQQVQAMSDQRLSDIQVFPKAGQHNLTLLHLAAGLGFAKLISCLIRWRMATECVALEFDVDAQSVDSHSCTPLTWACVLGKIDAALTLYHWNAAPLKMCNKDGLLPLTLARQKGHYNLACQVEQLELAKEQEENRRQQQELSTMDLSCSPGPLTSTAETPTPLSTAMASSEVGSVQTLESCLSSVSADTEAEGADAGISGMCGREKDNGTEMKDDEHLGVEVSPLGSLPLAHHGSPSPFSRPAKPGPKLIRRFSEQVMGHHNKPLSKRNSVDLLPSGQSLDEASLPGMGSPSSCMASPSPPSPCPSMMVGLLNQPGSESSGLSLQASGGAGVGGAGEGAEDRREEEETEMGNGISSISSPDMSDDMAFVVPPAPRLMLEEKLDEPSGCYPPEDEEEGPRGSSASKMDTDEIVPHTTDSPIIDVERISSDEEVEANKDGSKHQMVTLANQIIAAIPERIKLSPSKGDEADDVSSGRGRTESHSSLPSQGSPRPSSFGDDSGISTPMTDSLAFDEYRYPELGTPSSSLSPDSTCLPSPYSPYSFTLDSPPPTTAEFTEYFNAPTTYMEKDFSQLTLSDQEQRKLYEAAKVIQNAYRHYRDKQQQKEIEAAILIQSYYRRYKTYAYYKKMSQAAVLIQNQFRTYYARRKKRGDLGAVSRRESERLKKGRNQSVIIQQRFRSHYQRRSFEGKEGSGQVSGNGDGPDSSPPPPEGRRSPCRDGTPPTDVDSQTSAAATEDSGVDSSSSLRGPASSSQGSARQGGCDSKRARRPTSKERGRAALEKECEGQSSSSSVRATTSAEMTCEEREVLVQDAALLGEAACCGDVVAPRSSTSSATAAELSSATATAAGAGGRQEPCRESAMEGNSRAGHCVSGAEGGKEGAAEEEEEGDTLMVCSPGENQEGAQ